MTTSILFIDKKMTGYGNWDLTANFSDGTTKTVHTTNSRLIDEWFTDDNELNEDNQQDIINAYFKD